MKVYILLKPIAGFAYFTGDRIKMAEEIGKKLVIAGFLKIAEDAIPVVKTADVKKHESKKR